MTAEAHELLETLRRAGMRVSVRDDGALVLGPRSRVTNEWREAARRLKPALVALIGGNGVEVSRAAWTVDYAETLAATAPPGGWPLGWRDELRAFLPALDRRIERAEAQAEAVMARLKACEPTAAPAWATALREYEVTLLDARAALIRLTPARMHEEKS